MPILRSCVMQVVFINECKSSEISSQIFFNVMFSVFKTKHELVEYCKILLFSGAISQGASNEPERCLESSQTSTRERFRKNS